MISSRVVKVINLTLLYAKITCYSQWYSVDILLWLGAWLWESIVLG